MNKKRFFVVLLALIMCILSGCSLIDNPGESGTSELKITDDFMVGMFLYVEKYDSAAGDHVAYPTNKFGDENAISLYHATRGEKGYTYGEFISSEYLSGICLGISNAGTDVSEANPYGAVDVKATFVYTYEMLGGVVYAQGIYMRNGKDEYYVPDKTLYGYYLNDINISLSSEQNIKVYKNDTDGTAKELKYDGKWSLDVKFVDYLVSAKTIEFDKNHNVIKNQSIDFESGDFIEHQVESDCEYIFVEEEYEVKHSDEDYKYPVGTKYTQRYFFNKSNMAQYHTLYAPVGNGFVKDVSLKIQF